jgi:hypothetical protein
MRFYDISLIIDCNNVYVHICDESSLVCLYTHAKTTGLLQKRANLEQIMQLRFDSTKLIQLRYN